MRAVYKLAWPQNAVLNKTTSSRAHAAMLGGIERIYVYIDVFRIICDDARRRRIWSVAAWCPEKSLSAWHRAAPSSHIYVTNDMRAFVHMAQHYIDLECDAAFKCCRFTPLVEYMNTIRQAFGSYTNT